MTRNDVPAVVERGTRLGRIRGVERLGVESYLGIRYAEPARRFEHSTQAGGWTGTLDATQPGNQPYQAADGSRSPITRRAPGALSEDCLLLNVHVPAGAAAEQRPVLVWIYGGSFNGGSANQYDGSALAATAGIVVVTINYRVGALGMADLRSVRGSDACNFWFTDQLTALRWVRANIEDFGGDPANITVAGQSAGATSTLAVLASPKARDIVRRAAAFSPAFIPLEAPADAYDQIAARAGIAAGDVPQYLLESPVEPLLAATAPLVMQPFVDGQVIARDPHAALAEGSAAGKGLITGLAPHEGEYIAAYIPGWAPRRIYDMVAQPVATITARGADQAALYLERLRASFPGAKGRQWLDLVCTDMFRRSSIQAAEAVCAGGGQAWHYLFDVECRFGRRKAGSTHCVDLPFTFNWFADPATKLGDWVDLTSSDNAGLAQKWIGALRRFMDGSDPEGPLGPWPGYSPETRDTLVVAPEPCVIQDLDPKFRTEIWPEAAGHLLPGVT